MISINNRSSQTIGPQSSILADLCQGCGADFLAIMKAKREIWPTRALEFSM